MHIIATIKKKKNLILILFLFFLLILLKCVSVSVCVAISLFFFFFLYKLGLFRSMVLQLLLLIFLAALITTENNTTHSVHAIKIDYFDSFQSIDPIPLPTFALNQDSEITTTLIKTTTVTTATDSSNVEQDEEEENAEMEDEDDGEEDDIAATTTISFPDTSIQTAIYQTSSSSKHVPITNSTTNSTIQYTNTSDPLVQYDLDCQADDTFCSKINRVVGAAIDEFSRVVNVKNSLM